MNKIDDFYFFRFLNMYMPFCLPYSFYLVWCWVNAGKCCCSNTTNAGFVWRKGHNPFWSLWECKWFFVHWRCCHSQTICSHWHLGLAGIHLSPLSFNLYIFKFILCVRKFFLLTEPQWNIEPWPCCWIECCKLQCTKR